MPFFRRPQRSTESAGSRLVTVDHLNRLARHGRARYEGTVDVLTDSWPINYRAQIRTLDAQDQRRFLEALLTAIKSIGGWVIYGAEDIVDGAFEFPGNGDATRDAIFEAAIDFQHEIGVWWDAMSPMEHMFWQERHPDDVWLVAQDPPSREEASISPLGVGEERRVSMLTGAADSRSMYVVRPHEDRYVLQLDYADDDGNRLRDDRDETTDLYELYWRFGRGTPLSGIWVDPELEPFLRYPMPRI